MILIIIFWTYSDLYQITMAYAYWKADKISDTAVFDLFFRKNPFHGEFTIFAGLDEVLKFLENFHYSDSGKILNTLQNSMYFYVNSQLKNIFVL